MILELHGCTVDLDRGRATRSDGAEVALTSRESDLLRYLAERPREPVARDRLLSEVWGYADTVLSRAADNAMRRLRMKIEADPAEPRHLLTVHGSGYRFEPLSPPDALEPTPAPPRPGIPFGDRTLDLARHRIVGPDGPLPLTAQEVVLMEHLLAASGAVVAREVLQRAVWGTTRGRAIDNAVSRLRAKLEPDPNEPDWLLTERGQGYRLVQPRVPSVPDDVHHYVARAELETRLTERTAVPGWTVVTGPAGIGKTRLVRRVASARSGPAFWVEAAGVTDVDELVAAIARVLEVPLDLADLAGRLGRVLAGQGSALLVLDDLERCADAVAAALPAVLTAAPQLAVVGTSRIRLGLDAEHAFDLEPLHLEQAVDLFLRRARAANLQFRASAADVRALVERLDGLPLAIELAAARTTVLSPAQLLERIGARLDLLVRPRATVERHRSLRAALESSWELTPALERSALMVLAMFGAGFEAPDAEALLGLEAIDVLQELRDASWIRSDPGPDGPRFRVFEAVRDFVAEQRAVAQDGGRRAELAWARRLARFGDPDRIGVLHQDDRGRSRLLEQVMALEDLDVAAGLALRWGDPETAAQCALGAAAARLATGPYPPGLRALDAVGSHASSPRVAAWMALVRGQLLDAVDRDSDSVEALAEAMDGAEACGDRLLLGLVLLQQGLVSANLGRRDEGLGRTSRAAAVFEEVGRPELAAFARAYVESALGEDAVGTRRLLQQAIALAEQVDDARLQGIGHWRLATHEALSGRLEDAADRLEHAADVYRRSGDRPGEMHCMTRRMSLLGMLGRHDECEQSAARALAEVALIGSGSDEAMVRGHLASAQIIAERPDQAMEEIHRARAALGDVEGHESLRRYIDSQEAWVLLQEDPQRALVLARGALAFFEADGPSSNLVHVRILHARVLSECADPGALAAADRAVDLSEALQLAWPEALARVHRGLIRAAYGESQGALEDAEAVGRLAVRAGVTDEAAELSRLRRDLDDRTGA